MNASHARPLAAFCLLTAVAAVITAAGLRADEAPGVGPVASSAPVSHSAAPEPVPTGALHARSDLALRHPLSPQLWAPDGVGSPSAGSVQVAAPTRPPTFPKARTKSTGAHHTTAQTKGPAPSTAAATPTSNAGSTNGTSQGKGKPDHPVHATPANPSPTPTDPGKGPGVGQGVNQSMDQGKPDKPGH